MFSGSVYLGIMLGYFASYGTSLHISNTSVAQWVIPNTLHLYFAAIIFVLSFFAIESPRWLVKVGKHEQAAANLSKLRNLPEEHSYVQTELLDINEQLDREREATMGTSWLGPIKELFLIPSNQYRIFLAVFAQLLGQWSGANSITIYAPEYFAMMGTTGSQEKLFATAIFGVVKFVSALICALFLIDFIGRKRALSIGITIQFVTMLYMAIFLLVDTSVGTDGAVQSASQKSAAMGAIVMIYFSGFGWAMGSSRLVCFLEHLSLTLHRLELNSISHQRRDLSTSSSCYRRFSCHDNPFRQPIRQQQGCTGDVHRTHSRRYHAFLLLHHCHRTGMGVVFPA